MIEMSDLTKQNFIDVVRSSLNDGHIDWKKARLLYGCILLEDWNQIAYRLLCEQLSLRCLHEGTKNKKPVSAICTSCFEGGTSEYEEMPDVIAAARVLARMIETPSVTIQKCIRAIKYSLNDGRIDQERARRLYECIRPGRWDHVAYRLLCEHVVSNVRRDCTKRENRLYVIETHPFVEGGSECVHMPDVTAAADVLARMLCKPGNE